MPRSPSSDRHHHARPGQHPHPFQLVFHGQRPSPVISPPPDTSPQSEHSTMSVVFESLDSGSPPPLVTSSSVITSEYSLLTPTSLPLHSAPQLGVQRSTISPYGKFSGRGDVPVALPRDGLPAHTTNHFEASIEVSGASMLSQRHSITPVLSQADEPMEVDVGRRPSFEAPAADVETARPAPATRWPLLRDASVSQSSDLNETSTKTDPRRPEDQPEWSSYPESRRNTDVLGPPERGLSLFPIARNHPLAGPSRPTHSYSPRTIRPLLVTEPTHLAALDRDLSRSGVHELGILAQTYRPSAFRPRPEFADRSREARLSPNPSASVAGSVPNSFRLTSRSVQAEPIRIPAVTSPSAALGPLHPRHDSGVSTHHEVNSNELDMRIDQELVAHGGRSMMTPPPWLIGARRPPSIGRDLNTNDVHGGGERASPHVLINEPSLLRPNDSTLSPSVPLPRPASLHHPAFDYPHSRPDRLALPSHRRQAVSGGLQSVSGPPIGRSSAWLTNAVSLEVSETDVAAQRSPYLRQRLADLDVLRTQAAALTVPVDRSSIASGMRVRAGGDFLPSQSSIQSISHLPRDRTQLSENTGTRGLGDRRRPLARRWLSQDEGQQGSSGPSHNSFEYSDLDFWNRNVQNAVTRRLPADAPRLETPSSSSPHRNTNPYMFARPHRPDTGRHRDEIVAETAAYPQPGLPGNGTPDRSHSELWGDIPIETANSDPQVSFLRDRGASQFAQRLQRYRHEPERRAEHQLLPEPLGSPGSGLTRLSGSRSYRHSPIESGFDEDWRNGHIHNYAPSYGSIANGLSMVGRGGLNPLIELFGYFQLKPDMAEADRCRILQTVVRAVSRWPSDSRRKAADIAIENVPWGDFGERDGMERDAHCSVCHDEYSDEVKISVTPCKHMYHKACLDTWLDLPNTSSCPMCRRDLAVLACLVKMVPSKSQAEALPVWLSIPA